jgi:aminoglycoside 6'-N-acetyltransferase I
VERDSTWFIVRPVQSGDEAAWLELRCALWPDGSRSEHGDEIARFMEGRARDPLAVLVAITTSGSAIGVVELSIRTHAEGCRTDRVAYLEGWYVAPEARGREVGRALVQAAEEWGRAQRCTEFASDAAADNSASAAAHRAVGFAEVGLVRCFRKDL